METRLTVVREDSSGGIGNVDALPKHVRQERARWGVALVSMPFNRHIRPSIQLGLLKSLGVSHGFPVNTFHLNLEFAHQIGPDIYEAICDDGQLFLGDWLFSLAAFGTDAPDVAAQFLDQHRDAINRFLQKVGKTKEYLLELRDKEVPAYIERMVRTVPWNEFEAVGFTSTFQQNVPSFALATSIKTAFPSITTLFGGANFADEMGVELVRSMRCIDYAIVGEADVAFPELLVALQEKRDPSLIAGVVYRGKDGVVEQKRPPKPFTRMDDLPIPDYDEYFERAEALGLLTKGPRRQVMLPFESARGCWWGQKHHCTFCGLNGNGMAFRSKSSQRLLEDLSKMAQRYRSFHFEAVDNILDMSYLKSFLPELIREGADYKLFYEVKANLTREQIKLLHAAGVRIIQPGIESLNSHILHLMRKGVTAIQNVNLLRWGLYYGIHIAWNLIYGFPGETERDYKDQESILRTLVHLQPPAGIGRVIMERFSPFFFDRATFPARYVRPSTIYDYIYPHYVNTHEVAYMFDYEFEEKLGKEIYEGSHHLVETWQEAWKKDTKPSLTYWSTNGFLQIEDLRDPSSPGTYTFEGLLATIYAALSDRPRSVARLKATLELSSSDDEIEAALEEFCNRGLMMRDGDLFLALALPATRGR